MARILIAEPVDEIRTLLGLIVAQLGHEPWFADGEAADEIGVDVALIEPASVRGLELASALRDREDVPIVFVSIELPTPATRALSPIRHILKPFERIELARAIDAALGHGLSEPRHPLRRSFGSNEMSSASVLGARRPR